MTESTLSLLTIIIPCFKAELTIARALDSLQKYIEDGLFIIVVEDGVFDGTSRVVGRYDVTHIQKQSNHGAAAARNSGLQLVETPYVLFLDADDWLGGGFLEAMLNRIIKKKADICVGPVTKVNQSQRVISQFQPPRSESTSEAIRRCLFGNTGPGICGILWRTRYLREIGGWNNDVRRNDDGELFIRALCNDPIYVTNDTGTAYYEISNAASLSKNFEGNYLMAERFILESVGSYKTKFFKISGLEDSYNFFCWKTAMLARFYKNQDLDFWRSKLAAISGPILFPKNVRPALKYSIILYNHFGFHASFELFRYFYTMARLHRSIKAS